MDNKKYFWSHIVLSMRTKMLITSALTLLACYSALFLQETHKAATFPSAFYLLFFSVAAVWFGLKSVIFMVIVVAAALYYPHLQGKRIFDVYDNFRLIAFPVYSIVILMVGESSLRVSRKLEQSHKFLENIVNNANTPIIFWDMDMSITKFNHAAEQLTGYSASEVMGQSPVVLFPPDKQAELMSVIRFTTIMVKPEAIEIPLQSKTEGIKTVLWNFAILHADDETTPIGIVAMGQDITHRRLVEGSLRENEKIS